MGKFEKNSRVSSDIRIISDRIASTIESEFNTKVFDYGILEKGNSDFDALIPIMATPPPEVKYLFYFLVPIDDADNIISNDYFEKHQKVNNKVGFHHLVDFSYQNDMADFTSSLRSDWDLSSFLQNMIPVQIYDTGAYRVKEYSRDDNTVANVQKLEDVRYRFFRFFLGA